MSRERPPTFSFSPEHDVLDKLQNLKPQPLRRDPPKAETRRLAEESGFSTREVGSEGFFDARSLRKTNRTAQLNISVAPDTKNRFWQFAQARGFAAGEDALVALLETVSLVSR